MRPHLNGLGWGNRICVLLLFVATATLSSAQSLRCGLGISWNEEESGYQSTWTRRGTSEFFDATYPTARVTTVNRVTVSGDKVYITRISGSDGNSCSYEGTVGPDGETITGSYKCLNGSATWNAKVICDPASMPPNFAPKDQLGDNTASHVKNAADIAPAAKEAADKTSRETKPAARDMAKETKDAAKKLDTAKKSLPKTVQKTTDTPKAQ